MAHNAYAQYIIKSRLVIRTIVNSANKRLQLKTVLKTSIKKWRQEHPIATTTRRDELKEQMDAWDLRAEEEILSTDDAIQFHAAKTEYFKAEKQLSMSLQQKARLRWAVDGDENTKFFHGIVKDRYKKHSIQGLNINGMWIKDPPKIKEEVWQFFKDHFTEKMQDRPSFTSPNFKRLDDL